MNQLPLVSVICLCHNQEKYVEKAIQSVFKQSYPNIELILIDDGSIDNSKAIIKQLSHDYTIQFIDIKHSIGNCKAFNRGFRQSHGEYIIDLAADDELMSERILCGANAFLKDDCGVNFCDTLLLSKDENEIGTHYKRDIDGNLIESVPDGNIYLDLIKNYFISPPSMMIKREVLTELSGYDESLSYEDFDFWIRSSRNWNYSFTDKILVKKRILPNSLSHKQFASKSAHQWSTWKVCLKIRQLNRTKRENAALRYRCLYEIKQCIRQKNWELIPKFLKLIVLTWFDQNSES